MTNSKPATHAHKPLHHHVLETFEHIVDRFGLYMALGAMLIMGVALLTAGHIWT